jgi:phosphatidate cytidylyltransferase
MLKQRLVTAFFLLLGMGWALFFTTTKQWHMIVAIIALFSFWEWAQLGRFSKLETYSYLLVTAVSYAVIEILLPQSHITLILNVVAIFFWLAVAPLWLKNQWHVENKWVHAALGWLLLFSTMFSLAVIKQAGAVQLLLLLVIIWLSDSAAYFTGRAIGKHKLAPSISPGKTWEGVAGALVTVCLYGVFLQFFWPWHELPLTNWIGNHRFYFYTLLIVIAILGVQGDLFESWLKRCVGVKDSGFILPGHGGVLDRIDALIATLPVMAIWTESLVR